MHLITEVASEALAFAIASLAMRLIVPPFSAPLAGISVGLLSAKLVIKTLTPYNYAPLKELTYEACLLRERYPRLQAISSVFVLSISLLSQTLGRALGVAIGVYGAIILDVENYKLMQRTDRKALLEKGLH
jgi:hypothetical protein